MNALSPEGLRELGSRASSLHVSRDISLGDAVIKVARENPGLNVQQVRRIIEFANNETFQRMWKMASGTHRVITFRGGPADPSYVLKELDMGTDSQPGCASINGLGAQDEFFETVKAASEDFSGMTQSMVKTAMRQWLDLKRMEDHFFDCYREASGSYEESASRLCKEARCLLADGGTVVDISRALTQVSRIEGMTKLALKHIECDFRQRGIEMEKKASLSVGSVLVRARHPLVQAFTDFEKIALERFRYAAALEHVQETKKKAVSKIQELSS